MRLQCCHLSSLFLAIIGLILHLLKDALDVRGKLIPHGVPFLAWKMCKPLDVAVTVGRTTLTLERRIHVDLGGVIVKEDLILRLDRFQRLEDDGLSLERDSCVWFTVVVGENERRLDIDVSLVIELYGVLRWRLLQLTVARAEHLASLESLRGEKALTLRACLPDNHTSDILQYVGHDAFGRCWQELICLFRL